MARKKSKKKSEEEIKLDSLKRRILELYEKIEYLPKPTRFLNVGDKVEIGCLKDAKVEKVLFGGVGYQIDYTSVNNNYGNPIETHNCKGVWDWLNVLPIVEREDSLINNADIRLNYSQMVITSLFSRVYSFGVDESPEYQRGYVWEESDKIMLIDSIFNNVDIGKFTFVKLDDYSARNLYEILDGKQRLKALCDFYESKFKYKGLYFHELSAREKDFFESYTVNIGDISGKISVLDKLRIFKMINTTGKTMDKNHLNNIDELIKQFEFDEVMKE